MLENWYEIQYQVLRSAIPDILQDIQDGSRYTRQSGEGNFFNKPEHAGLILFADGVPLFKSSGELDSYLHFSD